MGQPMDERTRSVQLLRDAVRGAVRGAAVLRQHGGGVARPQAAGERHRGRARSDRGRCTTWSRGGSPSIPTRPLGPPLTRSSSGSPRCGAEVPRLWIGAAGLLGAVAVAVALTGTDRGDPCAEGREALAQAWSEEASARVEASFPRGVARGGGQHLRADASAARCVCERLDCRVRRVVPTEATTSRCSGTASCRACGATSTSSPSSSTCCRTRMMWWCARRSRRRRVCPRPSSAGTPRSPCGRCPMTRPTPRSSSGCARRCPARRPKARRGDTRPPRPCSKRSSQRWRSWASHACSTCSTTRRRT